MKIKHLREWLETIPEEFDEYDLVFRNVDSYDEIKIMVKDTPITAMGGDDENEEVYFCDTETYNILIRE